MKYSAYFFIVCLINPLYGMRTPTITKKKELRGTLVKKTLHCDFANGLGLITINKEINTDTGIITFTYSISLKNQPQVNKLSNFTADSLWIKMQNIYKNNNK